MATPRSPAPPNTPGRHPGQQEGEKATGQGRDKWRKYSQLSMPWGSSHRRSWQRGTGHSYPAAQILQLPRTEERRGTHGKETVSYLDEVWKMARL